MPFIYQAALWCDSCGQAIRDKLDSVRIADFDPEDETSYDSDDYPKFVLSPGESDCPDHCDAGEECLECIELSDSTRVGALITEELTCDGAEYVAQAVKEGGLVAVEVWRDAFSWIDFDEDEDA